MKVAIGILIIIASFAYILKRPGKSMMDTLMEDKQKKYEEALAKAQAEKAEKEKACAECAEEEKTTPQ